MFTIGEFSKLCRVSARMLRHYDALGLLRPALIGRDNGYRYYDASQVAALRRIETLKGYGFPLRDISRLMDLPEEELAKRVHVRRLQAYAELHDLRARVRRMEDDLMNMEQGNFAKEKYHVILLHDPEQRVFGIRRTIQVAQMHELFDELYREMERRGLRRAGATQSLYHGEEFHYESMDVEAQAQVEGDSPDVRVIPARTCAATTHAGPYETIKYAYDALAAWMGEHPEYRVCGPAVERYLKDEDSVKSPEEMETGVLFPIERRE